jgi:hypothetical protein
LLPTEQVLPVIRPRSRADRLVRFVLFHPRMRHLVLVVVVAASACAGRAAHPTLSPQRQADLLTGYAHGESLDQLATEYSLGDRDEARDAVRHALRAVQERYYRDH